MAASALLLAGSGCGVRQYNSRDNNPTAPSSVIEVDGPFYSSGQKGDTMGTPACALAPGVRPCMSARASVGMPYGFDINDSGGGEEIDTVANPGPLYMTPYATLAGAGRTYTLSGPPSARPAIPLANVKDVGDDAVKDPSGAGDFPHMDNRDLGILQRQAADDEFVF